MRSPVYALVWEQWRQVRLPIAFGMALALAASWTVHYTIDVTLQWTANPQWLKADREIWVEYSTVLAGISIILMITALLFTHSSPRDLRMGLPARMLTLPVSPIRIAATQVLFRFATVGLVALALGLGLTLIDRTYSESVLPLAGASILAYSYASAMAATIGPRSPVIAFLLTVFTIAPVLATVAKVQEEFGPPLGLDHGVFYLFVAVCAAITLISIARTRKAPLGNLRWNLIVPSRRFANTTRRDVAAGQFSYEWRRIGWMIPSFVALVGATMGLAVIWSNWRHFRWSSSLVEGLAGLLLYGPPIVAFLVGMILLAREHRDSVTGISRFGWTRPVTVQQAVVARMKVVSLSMAQTFGSLIILTALVAILSGVRLGGAQTPFVVLCYVGLVVLSWCVVWVPYAPIAYWLYLAAYAMVSNFDGIWDVNKTFWFFYVPDMAALLALALLAYGCWRRKIFDKPTVLSYLALSLGLCALVLFALQLGAQISPGSDLDDPIILLTGMVLSFMPLFSLFAQGVFLDHVRHGALFRRLPARNS